ncbi:MAG: YfhO family protein [Chloroflexi bacterium]|nr:YfhO family protein [Chloroflexota bacterium]
MQPQRPVGSELPAVLLVGGGALLPFVPHLVAGTLPFEDDLPNYFWPVMENVAAALRAGHLPLWTAKLYGGFPLFADPEAGTLFPLNWLMALISGPAGLRLVLMLATDAAALSMYAFARHLKLMRPAAVIVAWTYGLGGFFTGHLVHVSMLNAAWPMPLVILALDRALAARGRASLRWMIAAGLLHGMQWLGGHVQPPILTWLLASAWAIFRLWISPLPRRPLRTMRAQLAALTSSAGVIGAVAFGAAAAQLLPTLELAQQGTRAGGVNYAYAASYAVSPFDLVTLVSPYFFQHDSGVRWGLWANWETAAYAGILPLMLAIFAVCVSWRAGSASRAVVLFLTVLASVSLWLATSPFLPINIHQLLYHLPVANVLRAPARFTLLFDFAVALLAGYGAHALLGGTHPANGFAARRVAVTAAGTAVALAVVDFAVAGWIGANRALTVEWLDSVYSAMPHSGLLLPPERLFDFLQWSVWIGNPRLAVSLLLLAGAALWLAGAATGRLPRPARTVLALALTLVDLAVFAAWFWQPVSIDAIEHPVAAAQLARQEVDRRVLAWPGSGLQANRPLAYGLVAADGYSSLELKRKAQVIAAARLTNNRMLDVLGVDTLALRPAASQRDAPINIREPVATVDTSTPVEDRMLLVAPARVSGRIHLVSALEYAPAVEQGTVVGYVIVSDADGKTITRTVRAGEETAEWALLRPDVQATARHRPAPLAGRFDTSDEQGRRGRMLYEADIDFGQMVTASAIQFQATVPGIRWHIFRVSVGDQVRLQRWDLARFETLRRDADTWLIRNRRAPPRARLVPGAIVETDAGRALARLNDSDVDPSRVIVIEDATNAFEQPDRVAWESACTGEADRCDRVRWERDDDMQISLSMRAPASGWLLLADTWYPGWRATLDGAETPIVRANYAQRAVRLPEGTHTVEFFYDPPIVRFGIVVSALSMTAALAALAALSVGARSTAR